MNYMLKDENSIYYECGYSCDNAIYISIGSEAYFITDSRYTIDAKENVSNARVLISPNLAQMGIDIIKKAKIKEIIFDPKEWNVALFDKFSSSLKTTFKPVLDYSHKKRIIKTQKEIEILSKAVKLGEKAFKKLAKEFRENGLNQDEYTLTHKAKNILSYNGKYSLSFDPIVAINQNSAKPHATPTKSKLSKDDLLLVDAGLKYKRYCSDRTRTMSVNKSIQSTTNQKFKTKKRQKIYDTVLKAHDNAIKKAKSGMKSNQIDALTRDIIDKAGFKKYFVHSTGHGVGLDIHEMPYISAKSNTIIEDNMVYTIEPGIYIPNEFGVRIEDMVVMRDGRAEVLW